MSAIPSGRAFIERRGSAEPMPDQPLETAWLVLEAANDLADDATVAACRRVIDAGLNGTPACETDLTVIVDYFR